MYGVSIDDEPSSPVGTPATRRTIAIHWEWTTEYTREQMATALGVRKSTIDRYIRDGPTEEVQSKMGDVESEVRMVAVAELKAQLKAAGHRSRTAEKPVKVWPENGDIHVSDIRPNEDAPVVDRVPIPDDYDLMPNEEARYYAREEVRDIIEQLVDITGVAEPDRQQIEHSGKIDGERTLGDEEKAAIREGLASRRQS